MHADQVLLPAAEEPARAGGGGGGRQGAAVRRRVGPEQHRDDAAAAQEARAGGGGAAAARAAAAGGAAAVARVRAGQARRPQVLHRGAVPRHHGPDQARQARLPRQGLHLHPLARAKAKHARARACCPRRFVLHLSSLSVVVILLLPPACACVRACVTFGCMGPLLLGCCHVCTEDFFFFSFLVLESFHCCSVLVLLQSFVTSFV
jgi:hypothetical protein